MKEHRPSDQLKKDLENLLARINALEISAPDDYQKGIVKVLRALVEGQIHSVEEFEHLKKAIDLVTLQLFEVQKKQNS
ncbi:MAG: hypothetical protein V3T67_02170 [Nitrosopumilaceae archaeon]